MPEDLRLALTSKGNIEEIEKIAMFILYPKYDENKQPLSMARLDLKEEESEGTKKFFGILGPILDTLKGGKILVIDELDARFHPSITKFIINLFHSRQTNTQNAQIIFATHDTNLLNKELFRRDQIWFTEKDQFGATDLYSLVEYRVRKDASFQKDYIQGKYGAIPFIGDFESFLGIENG
jgi:uncharacterized protein